jgi:hypothetical protein
MLKARPERGRNALARGVRDVKSWMLLNASTIDAYTAKPPAAWFFGPCKLLFQVDKLKTCTACVEIYNP